MLTSEYVEAAIVVNLERNARKEANMNEAGAPCPRTRAFLMAHASTLTINIYRTRQEGALYLLVN